MNWKAYLPTIIPLLMTVLAALTPAIQAAIGHYAGGFFLGHPVLASVLATGIVAVYHALPSPLQR